MDIGHGCMVVKNYIYQKYGGIKSLSKVYSGYEVDSEVRAAGFREKIGLPSVYFSASVNRALADIKIMWAQVRNGINDAVSRNERFSPEDRHYIRFVLKTDICYWNILNEKTAPLLNERALFTFKQVMGVEPTSTAWKAVILADVLYLPVSIIIPAARGHCQEPGGPSGSG